MSASAGWLPLQVAGLPLGRVIPPVATALHALPRLFAAEAGGFRLRDDGADTARRSALLQEAALALREAGLVPGWRNESCVLHGPGDGELARFERGAFRTLGLQNRAVHINGVRDDGRLWIARRSLSKQSAPGKLDNLAAGAISAGESPGECALRELWEEAGVPAALAARVAMTGTRLRSLRPLRHGYHDEIIHCADLSLPDDFQPACQDGEVAGFLCLSPEAAADAARAGEFSVEAGMVLEDWLQRRRG